MARSPWRQNRWIASRQKLQAGLVVACVIVALAVGYSLLKPPVTIRGHAEIVDGDTLRIGDSRIRLTGLDAPELDQTCTDANDEHWDCGMDAKTFVIGLLAKRTATCISSAHDVYGRSLARCDAGQGDIGAAIVASGWAIADGGYGAEAADAKSKKLGIWSGAFVSPAEWRRSHGVRTPGLWDWITSWFHS
jgi:endonuclease YncB( thermonuclease family)